MKKQKSDRKFLTKLIRPLRFFSLQWKKKGMRKMNEKIQLAAVVFAAGAASLTLAAASETLGSLAGVGFMAVYVTEMVKAIRKGK